MTFMDIAHGFQDHWASITKWSVAIIGALISVGIFLGVQKNRLDTLNDSLAEFKQEQRFFNSLVIPLPERVGRLEEAGKGDRKILLNIQEMIELRTDVPAPKNSAPKRRP